ncbi:type VI secretion system lipoprotein TssJ [Cedecea sp. FDAARGOS_727]|uniref:type VI secretion system lipoprotein TssJ n=1 Tax=Cedecea sp. FDAARGOS_727 TaxID=2545798 RepID=UPI00143E8662|nr:type VI secretion system lipoprotein TssJ [Cedecea sp. FDAARGOS_727]QIX97575.1 type VI secretion system lipoprotein TssJ [Cedecea sp. FDAARGOS_727]
MLPTNLTKSMLMALLACGLSGCGLGQSVADGTKSAFSSVFYKQIKVLHLDFTAREALNTDPTEIRSFSEPMVVRIYQLKDRQVFDKALYQQLLAEGDSLLDGDQLASRSLVIKPGEDATLDMPMEAEAKFVAVVGFFRHPDMEKNNWKLVMSREALDPDKARVIEAGSHGLKLLPLKDE